MNQLSISWDNPETPWDTFHIVKKRAAFPAFVPRQVQSILLGTISCQALCLP
jgi:hypothetical protein